MHRTRNRLLSLALSLVMLLSLLPAMSLTASAAARPTDLRWNGTRAEWTAPSDAAEGTMYYCSLWKGDDQIVSASTSNTFYDWAYHIDWATGGSYHFKVKAGSTGTMTSSSEKVFNYSLACPTPLNPRWEESGGKLYAVWDAPSGYTGKYQYCVCRYGTRWNDDSDETTTATRVEVNKYSYTNFMFAVRAVGTDGSERGPRAYSEVLRSDLTSAHNITVTHGTAHYSIWSAQEGAQSLSITRAEKDSKIVLYPANKGSEGKIFKQWKVTSGGVTVDNSSFTMPDHDVVIEAEYDTVSAALPDITIPARYTGEYTQQNTYQPITVNNLSATAYTNAKISFSSTDFALYPYVTQQTTIPANRELEIAGVCARTNLPAGIHTATMSFTCDQLTTPLTATVTFEVKSRTYSAEMSVGALDTKPAGYSNYGLAAAVTIENTGDSTLYTNGTSVSLSGAGADKFTVGTNNVPSNIAVGETNNRSWYIRPIEGLPTGTYTANVVFKDIDGRVNISKPVSFEVRDLAYYTIHFDPNGGIGSMSDVTVDENAGRNYNIPHCAFTKGGSVFDYWEINGVPHIDGSNFYSITAGTTFKAIWRTGELRNITVENGMAFDGSLSHITKSVKDAKVFIHGTASGGGAFIRWEAISGSVTFDNATAQNTYFIMPDTDVSVKAVFGSGGGSIGGGGGALTYDIAIDKTANGSITASAKSASKGDDVTLTVTPDKGYALDALTVLDQDGKEVKLTEKDGKYTFTMPAGKVTVKGSFAKLAPTFSDVPADAWYAEAVKWAAEKEITDGIGGGLFGPNEPCTRAQIVTFLWRAAGSPEPKAMSSFADVTAGSYYAKAVAWAVENGITTGVGGNNFAPDLPCDRAQAVTFLYRALSAKAEGKAEFSDVPAGSYYADAVAWAAANGVTTGVGGDKFAPTDGCTRAQIVTFLYRAYNK